jgi:hypothetical protein
MNLSLLLLFYVLLYLTLSVKTEAQEQETGEK